MKPDQNTRTKIIVQSEKGTDAYIKMLAFEMAERQTELDFTDKFNFRKYFHPKGNEIQECFS